MTYIQAPAGRYLGPVEGVVRDPAPIEVVMLLEWGVYSANSCGVPWLEVPLHLMFSKIAFVCLVPTFHITLQAPSAKR